LLKAFLKDSALYGVANMSTRAIQLLLVPLYTRVLAPADYGSVDIMMVVAAVTMSILSLEILQGMARSYGDAHDADARIAYTSTTLWFSVGAASILVLVGLFGTGAATWLLGAGREQVFRFGVLAIAGQMLFNLLTVHLRFAIRPVTYGIVTVLYTVTSNAVAVVLVVWGHTGVVGVFYGQCTGYLIAGTVAWVASRDSFRFRFDRVRWREMITFSAPLVFSVIGGHVALLTDRVAVKWLLGMSDVGVYGIAARAASTMGLILSAFGSAFTPLLLARYRDPETPAELARLFRVFLLLVLPMLTGLILFADEIVRILAPGAYHGAADVIPLLAVAALFSGMPMFTPGMELARKTRLVAVIVVVTGFENVGLNLVFIPMMGVAGAALATMISLGCGFAAYLVVSQRYYPVPHRWPRLFTAAALAALTPLLARAIASIPLGLGAMLALKALLWLAVCGGLALALLDRRDLTILRDRLAGRHRQSPV